MNALHFRDVHADSSADKGRNWAEPCAQATPSCLPGRLSLSARCPALQPASTLPFSCNFLVLSLSLFSL